MIVPARTRDRRAPLSPEASLVSDRFLRTILVVFGSLSASGLCSAQDATALAAYRGHSRYFTDTLAAQGKTVWRSSTSLTGTYTLHAARGNYLSLSLGYVRGPALSPRIEAALRFTVNWSLYI
jgi:hypothetical protein